MSTTMWRLRPLAHVTGNGTDDAVVELMFVGRAARGMTSDMAGSREFLLRPRSPQVAGVTNG